MTDPTQNTPPDTGLVAELRGPAANMRGALVDGHHVPDRAADALEAATARADKAEAERDEMKSMLVELQKDLTFTIESRNKWQGAATTARNERDAALSHVTEAKTEGWDEGFNAHATLRPIVSFESAQHHKKQRINPYRLATALAQSSGADAAQGGRDDG